MRQYHSVTLDHPIAFSCHPKQHVALLGITKWGMTEWQHESFALKILILDELAPNDGALGGGASKLNNLRQDRRKLASMEGFTACLI
jgi:hypothetical protein